MSNAKVDLKVILLGHKAVGKTSMFNRYVYDEFGKTAMTIGAYFAMKQCKIGGNKVYNLAIWVTCLLSHIMYSESNQLELIVGKEMGM